jgi:glycosyltransferase involved in cell wall biosynthesis
MAHDTTPFKILLLVPEYPPDTIGGGGVVFEALRHEYAVHHPVRVITGSTGKVVDGAASSTSDLIRIPELPSPTALRYLATTMPPTPKGFLSLHRAIREVDVVHAHGFGFPVVDAGIRLAVRRGIPVLHTLHGHPVSQERRGAVIRSAFVLYRRSSGLPALRRASAHTAVSESVAEFYREAYGVTSITIPNGVALPDEVEWPELDAILNTGHPLVISVGRLEWIKGQETLIRAVGLLQEGSRPVVVFIGADHGAGRALRELAHKVKLGDLCHFMGQQLRGRIAYAYSKADACVVTSHTEAFPAVPLEAMVAGAAVITSRLPGMDSYAIDGTNCEMFAAGNDRELADKLEKVLRDSRLRATLTSAARLTATRFSWARVARDYEQILTELFAARTLGADK